MHSPARPYSTIPAPTAHALILHVVHGGGKNYQTNTAVTGSGEIGHQSLRDIPEVTQEEICGRADN